MARTETAVDTKGAHAYLKTGAPHSEYYRLASYHGYPTDYCRHGTEQFPSCPSQFRGTPDCNESAALHSYGLDAHCR